MAKGDISGSKLYLKPNGYKAGLLMSEQPTDGTGDFTFARASKKNRINADLKLEVINNNIPPLSYDSNGCPFIKNEPQATNLLLYPISLTDFGTTLATLDNNGGAGYSSPSVDFPNKAFKLIESVGAGEHNAYKFGITATSGVNYSHSVFAKKGERNWLLLYDNYSASGRFFDLENGVLGGVRGTTPDNSYIEQLENGWYKCTIEVTSITTNVGFIVFVCDADLSFNYTGDGTSGVYICFPQTELGKPSSFTFTDTTLVAEGSTVTRLADYTSGGGDVNTYNSQEGVIYAEISSKDIQTASGINLSNLTPNERIDFGFSGGNLVMDIGGSGSFQAQFTTPATVDTKYKLAISYKLNECKFYVNGILIGTDTSVVVPAVGTYKDISFDLYTGGTKFIGNCYDLRYYRTIADVGDLITLTT